MAIGKLVRQPLAGVTAAVGELSAGRYDKAVGGADKGDEVGEIARALEGFRHGLAENRALRAGQEAANLAAETEQGFGAPPLIFKAGLDGETDAAINYWHFSAKMTAAGMRQPRAPEATLPSISPALT